MFEVIKNYQINGLELANISMDFVCTKLPEVLATSKQLTWVSILGDLGDNVKPTDASIPNTVSSVSFYSTSLPLWILIKLN
jgi:hypothetical protein